MQRLTLATLLASTCLLTACGFPAHDLTSLEKTADIEWVFGVFERNYAPAEWKQKEGVVSLPQAKKDCLDQSASIVKGDQFILHLAKCVNRFGDAHTRTLAGGAILPEFAQVAYLGFVTEAVRVDVNNPPTPDKDKKEQKPNDIKKSDIKPALKVSAFLPTTDPKGFPVQPGDFIIEANGKPIFEYIKTELVPYGNLGQIDASFVNAGAHFALRTSFNVPMPAETEIQLKIVRGDQIFDVLVPWSVKDAMTFEQDQKAAASAAADVKPSQSKTASLALQWDGDELFGSLLDLLNKFRTSPGFRIDLLLAKTFARHNLNPTLHFLQQILAQTAAVPATLPVEDAMSTATSLKIDNGPFVARVFVQQDGSRVGYVRIDTFSLENKDADKLAELNSKFSKMKVKGVILDTLNNGGGSLVVGMRMANLLTGAQMKFPAMQLALNENWMNGMHADSLYAPGGDKGSDAKRTLAGRVYGEMVEDQKAGLRISRAVSAKELDPFVLDADKTKCKAEGKCLDGMKVVLLVNEMCASMCDIFASVFRDNKIGTIIGSQTMGAGGNVVLHGTSPVSQIMMTQTESLIVDVNGQYLENQGVKPDLAIDTLNDATKKYADTYKKAFETINL